MTSLEAHPQPPQVRDLTRRGIPLHFAPAVVVVLTGLGMLFAGGVLAGFGGWLLAAALPIAIGGFLRSPWFAAVPPAVWACWLVVVGLAPEDATLAHTPAILAIMLAAIGAGATLLAQRAIFPATDPDVWEVAVGRAASTSGDEEAAAAPASDDEDLGEIDEEVFAGIQATEDETAGDDVDELVAAELEGPEANEPEVEHVAELPLGADPAPLDEGGHVTDFPALSLDETPEPPTSDDDHDKDSDDDDAPDRSLRAHAVGAGISALLPAATSAGRLRGLRRR